MLLYTATISDFSLEMRFLQSQPVAFLYFLIAFGIYCSKENLSVVFTHRSLSLFV